MREFLDNIDMTPLVEYIHQDSKSDFLGAAGAEHYRFLSHICAGKDLVYDIGTFKGSSSIAMSTAKYVKSFDIGNYRTSKDKENITYSLDNYLTKDILKADIILIDIAHLGDTEKVILDYLRKEGYKGLVIMDDVCAFEGLTKMWEEIPERKEIIDYGHYTGTGLIYFE